VKPTFYRKLITQFDIPAPQITAGEAGAPTDGKIRVQVAAPEGFSTHIAAPALTFSGFAAGCLPGVLVSINAFRSKIIPVPDSRVNKRPRINPTALNCD
jgi:hypothetical protein